MTSDDELRAGIEQMEAGRHSIALEHFAVAADGADPDERRAAMAFAADASLQLQRPYEAIAWSERLRDEPGAGDEADLLEGAAWVALHEGAEAVRCLGDSQAIETPYKHYPVSVVQQLRCEAFGLVGEADRARDAAVAALGDTWALPEVWRALANLLAEHDVDVTAVVASVPDEGLLQVLAWMAEAPAVGVDRLVETMWAGHPGDRRLLALMTSVGNRLPLERALVWSGRLREAGLASQCAVLGRAAREDLPARERILAAAAASAAFGDERAGALLELATTSLPDDEVRDVLDVLLQIGTDDDVDGFVAAAASTPRRALTLAAALLRRGAEDPAAALARHGVELSTGQPASLRDAAEAALDVDERTHLVAVLSRHGMSDAAAVLGSL